VEFVVGGGCGSECDAFCGGGVVFDGVVHDDFVDHEGGEARGAAIDEEGGEPSVVGSRSRRDSSSGFMVIVIDLVFLIDCLSRDLGERTICNSVKTARVSS
jgi:hypothetical protein